MSITTLGRRTVAEWLPIIVGHVVHHRDQSHDVRRLIRTGRVDLEPVVSHRFPLEQAPEAFEVASTKRDGAIKVLLEP